MASSEPQSTNFVPQASANRSDPPDAARRAFQGRAFVLGSGSPRRLELLRSVGVDPRVIVPDVDERVGAGESPERYLSRITHSKREAVQSVLSGDSHRAALVADTTVVCGETLLGKPQDSAEAHSMLRALSGNTHRVLTTYILWTAEGEQRQRLTETWVTFRALSEAEVTAYVDCGESLDKAGGYGIQGRAMAFVDSIRGSYSNVVGLPLSRVTSDLLDMRLVEPSDLFAVEGEGEG